MIYIFSAILLVSNNVCCDFGVQVTASSVRNETTPEEDNEIDLVSLFLFDNSSEIDEMTNRRNGKVQKSRKKYKHKKKLKEKKAKQTSSKKNKSSLEKISDNKSNLLKTKNAKHKNFFQVSDAISNQKNNNSDSLESEPVSKQISDSSDQDLKKSKSHKNKTTKTHQRHHKTHIKSDNKTRSKLQVTSSILLQTSTEISNKSHSHHKSSKKHTLLQKNKHEKKKLAEKNAKKGKKHAKTTVYTIPTFSAIDSRLKFITGNTSDIEFKYTQMNKFLGLKEFTGPYKVSITATENKAIAPEIGRSKKADDTENFKSPENVNKKIFLFTTEKNAPEDKDLSNNSIIKTLFKKVFDDIVYGSEKPEEERLKNDSVLSFKEQMKREKALDKNLRINVFSTSQEFSELEDKTDETSSSQVNESEDSDISSFKKRGENNKTDSDSQSKDTESPADESGEEVNNDEIKTRRSNNILFKLHP